MLTDSSIDWWIFCRASPKFPGLVQSYGLFRKVPVSSTEYDMLKSTLDLNIDGIFPLRGNAPG